MGCGLSNISFDFADSSAMVDSGISLIDLRQNKLDKIPDLIYDLPSGVSTIDLRNNTMDISTETSAHKKQLSEWIDAEILYIDSDLLAGLDFRTKKRETRLWALRKLLTTAQNRLISLCRRRLEARRTSPPSKKIQRERASPHHLSVAIPAALAVAITLVFVVRKRRRMQERDTDGILELPHPFDKSTRERSETSGHFTAIESELSRSQMSTAGHQDIEDRDSCFIVPMSPRDSEQPRQSSFFAASYVNLKSPQVFPKFTRKRQISRRENGDSNHSLELLSTYTGHKVPCPDTDLISACQAECVAPELATPALEEIPSSLTSRMLSAIIEEKELLSSCNSNTILLSGEPERDQVSEQLEEELSRPCVVSPEPLPPSLWLFLPPTELEIDLTQRASFFSEDQWVSKLKRLQQQRAEELRFPLVFMCESCESGAAIPCSIATTTKYGVSVSSSLLSLVMPLVRETMLFLEARAILSNGLSVGEASGLTGPQQWEELRTFYSALERMELATVNPVNEVELAPMEQQLKSRDQVKAQEVLDKLTDLIFSEDKREYVRNLLDALVSDEDLVAGAERSSWAALRRCDEHSTGVVEASVKPGAVALLVSQTDDVASLDDHNSLQDAFSSKPKPNPRSSVRNSLSPKNSWTGSLQDFAPHVVNIVATEVATFYDVFGVLGVPMIIMFVVSAAWTFMMAAIQIHADSMANAIMNTTEFDNGEFWLLPKPENSIIVSSVVLLTIFAEEESVCKTSSTRVPNGDYQGLPHEEAFGYNLKAKIRTALYSQAVSFAQFPGCGHLHVRVFSRSCAVTKALCNKYDKCVLASYQWNYGEKHCTCLVFADRHIAPAMYAEWTNPVDTTTDLAELAIAGELRIVQIINRAVPELPEELKNCDHLEQLILAYTKTEQLPEWVSEFSHLEFFRRLQTMSEGIFDTMSKLAFLHLGVHPDLEQLPSLSSLKNLRYLALAVMDSLKELPSFEGLSDATDLHIEHLPRVATLPSVQPLKTNFGRRQRYPCIFRRCCLSPSDTPFSHEKAAPTKHSTDELCNGVKYRHCKLNGMDGMCYNTRMMVINCSTSSRYIAMRKLQIQRGWGNHATQLKKPGLAALTQPQLKRTSLNSNKCIRSYPPNSTSSR
ncbi:Leucine-rich repeat domain, L domain-like [Phytophthora cactorum]|nr:Leucine-rich repeat domain, L domain-like [Phytophthora cactorum]